MTLEAMNPADPQPAADRAFLKDAVAAERVHLRVPSRVDWVERTVLYLADRAQSVGACDPARRCRLVTALTEAITNAIVHGNLEVPSHLKEQTDPTQPGFAQVLAERSMDPTYADRLVDIEMTYDGSCCVWTVTDQGPGFDVDQALARLDPPPDPPTPDPSTPDSPKAESASAGIAPDADPDPDADPGADLDFDPAALLASGRGLLLMRAFLDDVSWSQGGRQVRLQLNRCDGQGERRSEPRTPTLQPVRATPLPDDDAASSAASPADAAADAAPPPPSVDAVATNLSPGGVALLMQGLGSAQRLMVEVEVEGQRAYLPAMVCNITRLGDDLVQIGCRFQQPDPAGDADQTRRQLDQHDAIDRLLAKLGAAAHQDDDRRVDQRQAYTRPIALRPLAEPASAGVAKEGPGGAADDSAGRPLKRAQPQRVALGRDLSRSGLACVAEFDLPLGQAVEVILDLESPHPLRLRATVQRCQHVAGPFHDLGLRFLD